MTALDWFTVRAGDVPGLTAKVERVRLDRGGYSADNGCYFGVGAPVYRIELSADDPRWWWEPIYIRATDYQTARAIVRESLACRVLR